MERLADAIADRVAVRLNGAAQHTVPPAPAPVDRLLDVDQAAALLGVEPQWLYRHSARLPFTRRLSRHCLRFSLLGLQRYLERPR